MTGVVLVVAASLAILALVAFAVSTRSRFSSRPQGTGPQGDGPQRQELRWFWFSAASPMRSEPPRRAGKRTQRGRSSGPQRRRRGVRGTALPTRTGAESNSAKASSTPRAVAHTMEPGLLRIAHPHTRAPRIHVRW